MTERSARRLLWITYLGAPLLVAVYVATSVDAATVHGARFVNPLTWGFANTWAYCRLLGRGELAGAMSRFVAFWRSDPWGNWVLVDHAGLKVLLCFFLAWDARRDGRRVWPYNVAIWIVGALAPLLYLLPRLRVVAETRATGRLEAPASVAEGIR